LNDAEVRLHERIEDDHWWFVGKRLLLDAILRRCPAYDRLLDLGCGTGGVLRDQMARSHCVGIDRSQLALRVCQSRGFTSLARADLTRLPFQSQSFDVVVLLDVLEHLDDDVGFLRAASRICTPGGRMVISVPAFQWLWSQHDETFEHRRRYTAQRLEEVVRAAGMLPERTTYTNSLVFPVAAVWRPASYRLGLGRLAPRTDFWDLGEWPNRCLVALYRLEAWLLERVDLPVGVSVVCVARPGPEARRAGSSNSAASSAAVSEETSAPRVKALG
jgi:SAM-dependent methyltransferase